MKTKSLIYIALGTDIVIMTSKFVAAAITGSSAMVSEGIHSVIDAVSQLLLLLGLKKSRRRPDGKRPFGYGRELYFWSFMVSLIIFVIGGCLSFYEGLLRVKEPASSGPATMNYVVLGIAFIFTAVSAAASLKRFNKQRGEIPFWTAFRQSKDPATFIILLGDIGDLLGIVVAFAGIFLSHYFRNAVYDGFASMVIGAILIGVSVMLVSESKSLLMGEAIGKKTLRDIIQLAEADEDIIRVKKHFSIYLAPEEVVLQMVAVFKKDLTTRQITDAIERVGKNLKQQFPRIKQLFIEPAK